MDPVFIPLIHVCPVYEPAIWSVFMFMFIEEKKNMETLCACLFGPFFNFQQFFFLLLCWWKWLFIACIHSTRILGQHQYNSVNVHVSQSQSKCQMAHHINTMTISNSVKYFELIYLFVRFFGIFFLLLFWYYLHRFFCPSPIKCAELFYCTTSAREYNLASLQEMFWVS